MNPSAALRRRLEQAFSLEQKPPPAIVRGKSAAVLICVSEIDLEPRLWLIRRPTSMRKHAGQVAFPGGKFDEQDTSLRETALREAEEEIGLPRERVHVLGHLDEVVTGFSGYHVLPFVGWVDAPFTPVPNEEEVARVFSLPFWETLEALRNTHPLAGVELYGERLWGASAYMLHGLRKLLPPEGGEK